VGQQLVDKKAAREYTQGKKRDIHEADIGHLRQASASYLEVAAREGWKVIDCMADSQTLRPKEVIHEEIHAYLKE
jgi:dTMP kinase